MNVDVQADDGESSRHSGGPGELLKRRRKSQVAATDKDSLLGDGQTTSRRIQEASEEQMKEWIYEFVREVDTIDAFFVDKLKEYVTKFVTMQTDFLRKL